LDADRGSGDIVYGSGLTVGTGSLSRASPANGSKEVDMPTETIWRRLGSIRPYVVGDLDLSPPGFEEEGERLLARTWKIIAAQGALWIICGVGLAAWPEPSLTVLVGLMAVLAFVDGLMSGFAAFAAPLLRGERRWLALEAVVAIALGVVLLGAGVSSTSLVYVIGAWAIVKGVVKVTAARRLPLSGGRELLLFWSGIVSLVFGLVMLIGPGGGALALLGLIAVFAVVNGTMQIVFALELRLLCRRAAP
jgi:uncharacterized membrane protein HdeD (DUF308 family)